MSEFSTERVRGEFFESVLVNDVVGTIVAPCTWGQGCHRVRPAEEVCGGADECFDPPCRQIGQFVGSLSVDQLSDDKVLLAIQELYDDHGHFHELVSGVR